MGDSLLQKEFTKNKVQRLRNLISGKGEDKTHEQAGYNKLFVERTEGEIWSEFGKQWTIIDGLRQNIIKNKEIKDEVKIPLFCPNCTSIMKKKIDSEYYRLHKTCFNCVIKKEHDIKLSGKWSEYENKIHNEDIENKITEFLNWVEDAKNNKQDYVTEDGDVENWVGGDNIESIEKNKDQVIEYLNSLKR